MSQNNNHTKLKKDRRKHKRTLLNKKVSTNKGDIGMNECIIDISDSGCKLKTQQVYKIGEEILISTNGSYKVGKVIWNKGEIHGLEFKTPDKMLLEMRNKLNVREKKQISELVKTGDTGKVLEFINHLLCTLVICL
jgi:hypothetical protein